MYTVPYPLTPKCNHLQLGWFRSVNCIKCTRKINVTVISNPNINTHACTHTHTPVKRPSQVCVCCLVFAPSPHMSTCGYLFNRRQTQCNQMPLSPFFGERQHHKLDSLTNSIWTEDRLVVSQQVKNYRQADQTLNAGVERCWQRNLQPELQHLSLYLKCRKMYCMLPQENTL